MANGPDEIAEGSKRRLAKLAPKAQSWASSSGSPIHTALDIAAGLAGTDRVGYLLALRRWAHDYSVETELLNHLYMDLCAYAREKGWKAREDRLWRLTQLAVVELCHNFWCRRCKGTGVNRNQRDCRRCGGSGRRRISAMARARALRVDSASWYRVWKRRYEQLLTHLEARELAVLNDLCRALR